MQNYRFQLTPAFCLYNGAAVLEQRGAYLKVLIDNENEDTIFNDEHHLYINKKEGYKYISVTTLVGLYEQPYDSDFWSMYKAFERIVDPDL